MIARANVHRDRAIVLMVGPASLSAERQIVIA
jgi:hypothetical protein